MKYDVKFYLPLYIHQCKYRLIETDRHKSHMYSMAIIYVEKTY